MKSAYAYDHYSFSDVGSQRQNNEDSFGGTPLPNGRLFIVCDGMGAHQAGEHASSLCVKLIKEYFINNGTGNSSIDLYNAINFANEQLYITANNNPELKGMGTTVVALIIGNNEIFIGHVGDSRIYLHSSGELIQLTKDHSYVQNLVDQGIITRREMETHARKNELTNAIGIFPEIQPSINRTSIQVKAGDKFLLCTDGLNGMIGDQEILTELSSGKPVNAICENLISMANGAGGLDNITVSVVSINKSPFKETIHDGLVVAQKGSKNKQKKFYNSVVFQSSVVAAFLLCFFFLIKEIGPSLFNDPKKQPDTDVQKEDLTGTDQVAKDESDTLSLKKKPKGNGKVIQKETPEKVKPKPKGAKPVVSDKKNTYDTGRNNPALKKSVDPKTSKNSKDSTNPKDKDTTKASAVVKKK